MAARWIFSAAASHRTPAACSLLFAFWSFFVRSLVCARHRDNSFKRYTLTDLARRWAASACSGRQSRARRPRVLSWCRRTSCARARPTAGASARAATGAAPPASAAARAPRTGGRRAPAAREGQKQRAGQMETRNLWREDGTCDQRRGGPQRARKRARARAFCSRVTPPPRRVGRRARASSCESMPCRSMSDCISAPLSAE